MLEHEILSMDARDSLLFSMNKWIPHSYQLTSHKKLENKNRKVDANDCRQAGLKNEGLAILISS